MSRKEELITNLCDEVDRLRSELALLRAKTAILENEKSQLIRDIINHSAHMSATLLTIAMEVEPCPNGGFKITKEGVDRLKKEFNNDIV